MKKFKDLTIKGQKMRIVRDAILQIEKGIVTPKQGSYMNLNYFGKLKDFQKILQLGEKYTCEACAKGSLFASCVLNTDKVKVGKDAIDFEGFQKKKLSKWFSKGELDMIETAFEGAVVEDSDGILRGSGDTIHGLTKIADKCIKFYQKYGNSTRRLLAILKDIQKHGSFLDYERKIKPQLEK